MSWLRRRLRAWLGVDQAQAKADLAHMVAESAQTTAGDLAGSVHRLMVVDEIRRERDARRRGSR